MKGVISTYLSEKQYGFIKGDDGKDYFFHHSAFKDKNDIEMLCEGLHLEFEQKATPKGYSAKKIEILDKDITSVGYETPYKIYTSKEGEIRGWEIVELSDWQISSSSSDSPDLAKLDLELKASSIGANAILYFYYYKTTDSRISSSGKGTYYYTVHNYSGVAANIAKKSPYGMYSLESLKGINKKAYEVKIKAMKKTKRRRTIATLASLLLLFYIWRSSPEIDLMGSGLSLILLMGYIKLFFWLDCHSWLRKIT